LYDILSSGYNDRGQLGNGTRISSSEFKIIHTLAEKNIIQISSGMQHNACMDDEGKIYVWGSNSLGQLGITHYIQQGLKRLYPNVLKSLIDEKFYARSIVCGENHCVAIGKNGEVYTW